MLPQSPINKSSSRRTRDLLSGKEDQNNKLTKAQERARRVLEGVKTGVRAGVVPDRLSMAIIDRFGQGTSAARIRRRRKIPGLQDEEDEDELDKRAAEAEMGIASPLPRTLIRPTMVSMKKIHGLDGEVTDFKE